MIVPQTHLRPNSGNLHLLGDKVSHSIASPMHNSIAASLSIPWIFSNRECPTLDFLLAVLRTPSLAGAVITMPYKTSIIPHLSGIDTHAQLIGAVNNVYRTRDGKLRGTNTDWEGITGCLHGADPSGQGKGQPALIIGAGGASRAAVYALRREFAVRTIYILNRDVAEVNQLINDMEASSTASSIFPSPLLDLEIVHITTATQACSLTSPFYIIGTVPDFPPLTASELTVREILRLFLERPQKGVLLDMCFKPRITRTVRLAREWGWCCVEGTEFIGHQFLSQWEAWTGDEGVRERIDGEAAWKLLRKGALESRVIN